MLRALIAMSACLAASSMACLAASSGGDPVLQPGRYKVVVSDDIARHFGLDAQFNFSPDGTFAYSYTILKSVATFRGTYSLSKSKVQFGPSKESGPWPSTWQNPMSADLLASGDISIDGVLYTRNLTQVSAFQPGPWRCKGHPDFVYDFGKDGHYKFEGMMGTSSGEYSVEKQVDAKNGQQAYVLILHIEDVDGSGANFIQKLNLATDESSFVVLDKYEYSPASVAAISPVKDVAANTKGN